ncbi:hypothetical protein DEJ23_00405 [Curtobacterium sp. MCSS17_008]|nr:hypothetical protein DEJ23_00405 [Curtobacterium sp. MCSS17_008]
MALGDPPLHGHRSLVTASRAPGPQLRPHPRAGTDESGRDAEPDEQARGRRGPRRRDEHDEDHTEGRPGTRAAEQSQAPALVHHADTVHGTGRYPHRSTARCTLGCGGA